MAIIEPETSTKTRLQLIFTEVLDSFLHHSAGAGDGLCRRHPTP